MLFGTTRHVNLDLDAAGKPPSGVLRGNLYWSVSAEQCDAIPNSHTCGSVFTFVIPEVPLVCMCLPYPQFLLQYSWVCYRDQWVTLGEHSTTDASLIRCRTQLKIRYAHAKWHTGVWSRLQSVKHFGYSAVQKKAGSSSTVATNDLFFLILSVNYTIMVWMLSQ